MATTVEQTRTDGPVRDPVSAADTEKADASSSDRTMPVAKENDHNGQSNIDPEKSDLQASKSPEMNDITAPANEPAPPAAWTPPPVPDGGLQAWLQVAGAFMLFFNTW